LFKRQRQDGKNDGKQISEQVFAEQQAKQAISHRYVDPLDADPHYQDQIDRNRIPSASSPLSPSSAAAGQDHRQPPPRMSAIPYYDAVLANIRQNPTPGVLTAAALGFLAALLLRR
jgi:hypothetical protein